MKKRQVLSLLAAGAAISLLVPALAADPLQGQVKSGGLRRVARPAQPSLDMQGQSPLRSSVETNLFQFGAVGAASVAGTGNSPLTGTVTTSEPGVQAGAVEQPALNPSASSDSLQGAAKEDKLSGGAAAKPTADPPKFDYNAKPPLSGSVTFRFCYYDLGDGAECAWEGLRDANYLKGRGVDIALMLDRGGVRLANKHNIHEYQLHRGSTERLVQTQKLLREFIEKGGEVYASERWAKTFGLSGSSYSALTNGVRLLSDEEMADMLVERSGRIVEY